VISVIVPARNAVETIGACLEALLHQTVSKLSIAPGGGNSGEGEAMSGLAVIELAYADKGKALWS